MMHDLASRLRTLAKLVGFVPTLSLMITDGLKTEYRLPIVFFSIIFRLHLTQHPNA